LRVAGRVAGQRISGNGQAPVSQPVSGPVRTIPENARDRGRSAGRASGNLGHGVAGFLRPFGRVGSILWLEVMSVFFLLPVVVFAPTLWRTRVSWAHGPDHAKFLVTAGVMLLFLYLSVSSFWRAQRK